MEHRVENRVRVFVNGYWQVGYWVSMNQDGTVNVFIPKGFWTTPGHFTVKEEEWEDYNV